MALIRTVIDWESAFGTHPETGENVTLSKMTTEEYVRHPLFKVHGLGVKIDKDKAFYVYTKEDMLHFLKTHPWDRSLVVAHHAHFDGAVLSWRAGIRPAFWGDTLSMGRAVYHHEVLSLANLARLTGVGEKGTELHQFINKWNLTPYEQVVMGEYCKNDVELTADIFNQLVKYFPVSELRLIDLNIRMFTEPVLDVDLKVLVDEYKRERRTKTRLLKECMVKKSVLASNDQFAALLMTHGIDPPKKLSPSKVKDGRVDPDLVGDPPLGLLPDFKASGPKAQRDYIKEQKRVYPWAYAFGKNDEEFKLLQDHPDLQVQAIVQARLGVKSTLKETRSRRFYKIGSRGKFPVYHNYYGAHTGRDSGGDKQNTTNLNRVNPKDPTSGALRRSLLAPPGHVVVVRDQGQIEARKLAYLAGQEDLLQLFRDGGDPYNRQASKIFGYEVDRKKEEFFLEGLAGKASTLGNGYGMGWYKFQESLRVGFMGMPPIIFDDTAAAKVGASVSAFCHRKSWRPGCATLYDEAMGCKPLNVSEDAHLTHCATVWQIVTGYRASNQKIVDLWGEANRALSVIEAGGQVWVGQNKLIKTSQEGFVLPNGMVITYHGLRVTKGGEYKYLANRKRHEWAKIYGGKAVENCVQALARIVLTDQMLAFDSWLKEQAKKDPGKFYRVVTSTYDEIVAVVPDYRADEALHRMGIEMAKAPAWCADLPLKSGGGYAVNYGDCEK